jgi:SAM-dependent methyltransferase
MTPSVQLQEPSTRRPRRAAQAPQQEWTWQWSHMQEAEHQTEALFWEWISPLDPDDFRGQRVLDAGCGGGHMLGYIADYVDSASGVDLNTAHIVQRQMSRYPHIRVHHGDIARWQEERDFDIVYSIGVVHHTKDPQATARHLMTLVKPGGLLAMWVYGHEGNFWARLLVEATKPLYAWVPRSILWAVSLVLTALLNPLVWSLYRLPLTRLPYYEYFRSWRRLSFVRNATNVFDKLNAPTTHFIRRGEIDAWFAGTPFSNVQVTPWNGISWRILARRNH